MYKLTMAERCHIHCIIPTITRQLARGQRAFQIQNPPFFVVFRIKKVFRDRNVPFQVVRVRRSFKEVTIFFSNI